LLENNFINPDFGQTIKFYYAKVIKTDKDESEKANAIQFKISPLMDSWTSDHLPFAYPLNQFFGSAENSGNNSVPLVDSFVWITWIMNRYYYVFNAEQNTANLANKYFSDVQDKLGELENIEKPDLSYPECVSFFYESGICVSYSTNSDKPIYSIYSPTGSYCIIDKNGGIGAYSVDNLEAHAEKNIYITKKDGLNFYTEDKNIHLEDGNGNKTDWTDTGTAFEDKNANKITTDDQGMVLEDKNGNKSEYTSSGIKHTCLNSNEVEMKAGMVDINGGNLQILL